MFRLQTINTAIGATEAKIRRALSGRYPVCGSVKNRSQSRSRPRGVLHRGGVACIRLALTLLRVTCSAPMLGLVLALYGLATHYVTAARESSPFRIAGWFDVKAEIGNVFYAALVNTGEFFPHLLHGQWTEALTNLTNMAGIRSGIYTRLLHSGATNNAESFMLAAPWILFGLLALRLGFALHARRDCLRRLWMLLRRKKSADTKVRHRGLDRREAVQQELRVLRFSCDQGLVYLAQTGLISAAVTALLLNTVEYYQGLSGLAGLLGYLGSGLATAVDYFAAGSAFLKEMIWHAFYLLTDGKETTIGLLTHSQPIEDLSHYLARFPTARIPAALHTAVYQAFCAGIIWAVAHALQLRLARRFVGRYETLPPHMKRYLAARQR